MNRFFAALASFLLASSAALAADSGGASTDTEKPTPRLFWVIPNYATVEEARVITPISTKDKFRLATEDSLDPYAFPVAGFYAGVAYAVDRDADYWGSGPSGYWKRYVASLGDQTVSNYMTEGVFPSLLHEDPRYFRLGRGGFWHRTGYAISRVFLIRTDRGGTEFNYSEWGGNGVMAVAGNAYYPRAERTIGDTANRWGTQIGLDMLFNVAKEFWPDIRHALTGG
jgi:hypothetical protein